jgi:GNAT superfamily N-acetyltransferase
MIRKAILDDLKRIFEIRLEASKRLHEQGIHQWQSDKPSVQDFKKDIDDVTCFVYEIEGVIYGMITLQEIFDINYQDIIDPSVSAITIHRVAVSSDKLHQGIGHQLMLFAEHYARSLNKDTLLIDTHPDNTYMKRLIQSHHYVYIDSVTLKDIPSPLRYVYRKSLTKC